MRYVITLIDYLTSWEEASTIKDCSAEMEVQFMFENIVTRFGYLRILMSDQGMHFLNKKNQGIEKII